jgi:hypothetical protein
MLYVLVHFQIRPKFLASTVHTIEPLPSFLLAQ